VVWHVGLSTADLNGLDDQQQSAGDEVSAQGEHAESGAD
jgi:hypothetical protein